MLSVLFRRAEAAGGLSTEQPACFADLNLDKVIQTLTTGWKEYDLDRFFYTLLQDVDDIQYRHEVFQDLERAPLLESIKSFAAEMHAMRQHLAFAEKLYYGYEKKRWRLEAIDEYCRAVSALARDLGRVQLGSRALSAIREHLQRYVQDLSFRSMQEESRKLKEELAGIRYCLLVQGPYVHVRRYESEKDYATEVESIFAKFRHDAQKSYLVDVRTSLNLNHVEAMALDCVARVFPETFARLAEFCDRNSEFADATIVAFDREVQVYVAYLDLLTRLRRVGLQFCYPRILGTSDDSYCHGGYDLALADKLLGENRTVVCNDFDLNGEQQLIVVTGPNQGGKTTFARAFGQMHFLAALGFPVPGSEAQLPLADAVFTHFGKQEDMAELRGKLEDDLLRIHGVLSQCTSRSIIIMNEIFTSTSILDALFLSRNILDRVFEKGARGVLVTFLDELAAPGLHTVSMVAKVDPRDPTVRTFKVLRGPADGLAYAQMLAARHRLSFDQIEERVQI